MLTLEEDFPTFLSETVLRCCQDNLRFSHHMKVCGAITVVIDFQSVAININQSYQQATEAAPSAQYAEHSLYPHQSENNAVQVSYEYGQQHQQQQQRGGVRPGWELPPSGLGHEGEGVLQYSGHTLGGSSSQPQHRQSSQLTSSSAPLHDHSQPRQGTGGPGLENLPCTIDSTAISLTHQSKPYLAQRGRIQQHVYECSYPGTTLPQAQNDREAMQAAYSSTEDYKGDDAHVRKTVPPGESVSHHQGAEVEAIGRGVQCDVKHGAGELSQQTKQSSRDQLMIHNLNKIGSNLTAAQTGSVKTCQQPRQQQESTLESEPQSAFMSLSEREKTLLKSNNSQVLKEDKKQKTNSTHFRRKDDDAPLEELPPIVVSETIERMLGQQGGEEESDLSGTEPQSDAARPRRHLYTCPICNKELTSAKARRVHARIHTGDRPYHCKVCNKAYADPSNFKVHLKTHEGDKGHKCEFCEKTFAEPSTLKVHQRSHTGEKPFKCGQCGRAFSQFSNLNKHKRLHSTEKRFMCEVCGRQFRYQDSVDKHRRVHTDEKPYSCEICGKKFRFNTGYAVHLRTHTGEKPYVCEICGKAVSTSWNLKAHKRTHDQVAQEL